MQKFSWFWVVSTVQNSQAKMKWAWISQKLILNNLGNWWSVGYLSKLLSSHENSCFVPITCVGFFFGGETICTNLF